jgi:esterase
MQSRLAFDLMRLGAADKPAACTLVFLHALLASRAHWAPFAKHLSRALSTCEHPLAADALLVDARNHGDSPHLASHSMSDLCTDVLEFVESKALARASPASRPPLLLVGHSMGGKTALRFALNHPSLVDGLVLLDASPAAYTHSHSNVFAAMRAVDFAAVRAKSDVDAQLGALLPSVADRQFVMANNLRAPSSTGLGGGGSASSASVQTTFAWRANVPVLEAHERHVLDWDAPDHARYDGPALFIGGAQSSRLTEPRYRARVSMHFPRGRVEMVADAGHFPHASHASHCARSIADFVARDVLGLTKR